MTPIQKCDEMSRSFLELINEFTKVAKYRNHIPKSTYIYILATFNQKLKFQMQFHLQQYQKYDIPRYESCRNDVWDLYIENYKTLKTVKEDVNKSRDIPHSWVGILNIVEMPVPGSSLTIQSQRRAMPKNVQTTVQMHSFHMLVRFRSKSFKPGFSSM